MILEVWNVYMLKSYNMILFKSLLNKWYENRIEHSILLYFTPPKNKF